MKKMWSALTAVAFAAAALVPSLTQAQVAPAPSKDTANSSEKVAPKADEGTGAHPSKSNKNASTIPPAPSHDPANSSDKPSKKSKTKRQKSTASQTAPAPSHDTANSSAKTAPKTDEGTGASPSQKKAP